MNMNPVPTYADLYNIIMGAESVPYQQPERLYFARAILDAETVIDRLYDQRLCQADESLRGVSRMNCMYLLKTLYRFLITYADLSSGEATIHLCHDDLAAVFGYREHTLSVAKTLYRLLTDHNIIVPVSVEPTGSDRQPMRITPPNVWRRPKDAGRYSL